MKDFDLSLTEMSHKEKGVFLFSFFFYNFRKENKVDIYVLEKINYFYCYDNIEFHFSV